jgi:hypothetical protein
MRSRACRLIGLVGALLAVAALPAAAGATPPPSEPKTEPVEFTSTGVKLKGALDPEGSPTFYHFEYIQGGALECVEIEDCWQRTPREGPLTGGASQEVSAEVNGLTQGVYRYRLVAENKGGERSSSVASFTVPTPEDKAPVIERLSASHITQDDATLEAQIDPEGLETTYELWMEDPCPSPMECIRVPRLLYGTIPATATSESLSIDLASSDEHLNIEPGMTYGYWVIAKNAAGTTEVKKDFEALPASTAPVIESVSVSNLTATDATLEAQINTEGQSTSYEFLLSYDPCPECEDFETVRIDLPSGLLLPSFQDQSVSLDLASVGVTLRHGGLGEYEYSLRAISASGKTEARTQTFRTPSSPIVEPLGSTTSPGPISSEPEVPLPGGQHSTSGGSSSSAPAGSSTSAAVSLKPSHGKTSAKYDKHHKRKRHGAKAPKQSAKSKKQKR